MMTHRSSGNHRKNGAASSRHHLLELNVRTASLKRQRRQTTNGLLIKIVLSVVVLALLALGFRIAAEKFFFQNSEYSLHHLDAKLDGVMTQEELVAMTGFQEGKNIFQFDLDQANRKLAALPEVRTGSVVVERILPDTIKVSIERRIPLFLFAGKGENAESFVSGKSFLCDQDGVVIQPTRLDPEFLNLPVLRGIDPSATPPGSRLDDERLSFAIRLQQSLAEIPELNFKIRSMDVSRGYAAVVTDESHAEFTFGTEDLPGQMERLRKLLAYYAEIGRTIKTANIMVARNTPVTFVLTSETNNTRISPVISGVAKKNSHR